MKKTILTLSLVIFIQAFLFSKNDPFAPFTKQEQLEIKILFAKAIGSEEGITLQMRKKFWDKLEKYKKVSQAEIKLIQTYIAGFYTNYHPLFLRDAIESRKKRRPVVSKKRTMLENEYLKKGIITRARIEGNRKYIKEIAVKGTMTSPEGIVVQADLETLQLMLKNIEKIQKKVEILFTRPD